MPAMKVCAEAGCPELTTTTRCTTHTRTRDRARGTATERGYDAAHRRLRARWARKVATGTVACWRCGERLNPLEPWDLGHDDNDRSITRGPECLPCNRGTATRWRISPDA